MSRERRDLAIATLLSPIDEDQPSQCWDCKRASFLIKKSTRSVDEVSESGEKVKDTMGNILKVKESFLEPDIICDYYKAAIESFAYHCEVFEPLEDE